MDTTSERDYFRLDAALKPGDTVQARWTNCHSYWSAKATVVRVNRASLRVRLAESITVGAEVFYAEGREIVLPRPGFHSGGAKWSVNNGAFVVPAPKMTCGEDTLGADDIIRKCDLSVGHDGYCSTARDRAEVARRAAPAAPPVVARDWEVAL